MKELINKGHNFTISEQAISIKLNGDGNGLSLIMIASTGDQSQAVHYGAPRSGLSFTSASEVSLNLTELQASGVDKLDFFAIASTGAVRNVEAEIICNANDIKTICFDCLSSNSCNLGRIYQHNGAWKAKNLVDAIIGGVDNIHTLFNNPALTATIKQAMAPQGAPQATSQPTGVISMASSAPVAQQPIQMAPQTQSTTVTPIADSSPSGSRPTFGRNSSSLSNYSIDQEKVSEAFNNAVTQGKGLLNRVLSFSSQKTKEAADEVNRFRNKNLLMGTIAAGAYLAFADGEATPSELRNLLDSLQNHEYLKLFDHKDIVECFNSYIDTFKNDFDEGEVYVFETLTTLKGKVDECNIVLAIAMAVANEDNILTNEEQRALKRIRLIMDI